MVMNIVTSPWFIVPAVAVFAMWFTYLFSRRKEDPDLLIHADPEQAQLFEHIQALLKSLKPDSGLDKNLYPFLIAINDVAETDNCAFYMFQPGQHEYILQGVQRNNPERALDFPTQLPQDESLQYVGVVELPGLRLFNLPIGEFGLARFGVIRSMSRPKLERILAMGDTMRPLVDLLMEYDRLFKKADLVETSRSALQAISTMSMNQDAIIRQTFRMSASALGISGGCMIVARESSRGDEATEATYDFDTPFVFGYSETTNTMLTSEDNRKFIVNAIRDRGLVIWDTHNEADQAEISPILGNMTNGQLIAGYLPQPDAHAWFVCVLPRQTTNVLPIEQLQTAMGMMTEQLQAMLNVQVKMQPYSPTYSEFLKMLVRTMDNLNPYTTGYSEMLSRYATTIAKQLDLKERDVREIGLAAYLSRVGMLGISENLYMKDSVNIDPMVQRSMRIHAEVGAVIIETTLGNERIASYVRSQFEAMDGSGYPARLSGHHIPVGARIIAVVNAFLSAIHGRKSREPMTFHDAMLSLIHQAGKSLDPVIVHTFYDWFERKRAGVKLSGRALGVCWEMNCAPSAICERCPAYQRRDVNCWEFGENNCQSHGKTCKTCFVYTETLTRDTIALQGEA